MFVCVTVVAGIVIRTVTVVVEIANVDVTVVGGCVDVIVVGDVIVDTEVVVTVTVVGLLDDVGLKTVKGSHEPAALAYVWSPEYTASNEYEPAGSETKVGELGTVPSGLIVTELE